MPRTAEVTVSELAPGMNSWYGGGVNPIIQATNGALYWFVIGSDNDLIYKKSTDGGLSWGNPVVLKAGNLIQNAVWYDRWTPGLTTDLIHIVYCDTGNDDTVYLTLDTATDTLSTETTIYLGSTAASGGHISVTRARGGNVYCKTMIDNGSESGFSRLLNADVPNGVWAARTLNQASQNSQQVILMPGFGADDQDVFILFWDGASEEISRQNYDDSANTWSETSIATSMIDVQRTTSGPHYSACCHTTDSEVLMAAWSDIVGRVNQDLRFFTITDSTITEGTEVVLNSTDNQGACAIGYDSVTNEIYVYYCGKSDGSETWFTAVNVYYKISSDGGTTWGPENQLTNIARRSPTIWCCPRSLGGAPMVIHHDVADGTDMPSARCIARLPVQRSQSMIGT